MNCPHPGLGSDHRPDGSIRQRRIVVTLDSDQFDEVRAHALQSKLSLAAAVRELLEWGLEAVKP
jgi:hypothetical protein